MKMILTFILVAAMTGCAGLPAPKNANGSVNPSVAVADGELTYRNAATAATTYVATCHAVPTTIGCSPTVITQIKVANDKAWTSVQAAETAVRTLPAGATGIDQAIAEMQAAIVLLQGLIPHH